MEKNKTLDFRRLNEREQLYKVTATQQWTAEYPNEDGWYFVNMKHLGPRPMFVICGLDGRWWIGTRLLDDFIKDVPDVLWLKIEIPPLPEKNDELE